MLRNFLVTAILSSGLVLLFNTPAKSQTAEEFVKQGLKEFWARQYEKAIDNYSKAISIDPKNADAYMKRGNAYSANQNLKKAWADYTKVIELKPQDSDAYRCRAVMSHFLGRYDQAIADSARAIEIQPSYARSYYERGGTYFKIHEYEKAVADFDKTIQIDPKATYIYLQRSVAYLILSRADAAFADVSKSLAEPQDWATSHVVMLGYIALLECQKQAQAEAFLDFHIRRVDPKYWDINFLRYLHKDISEAEFLSLATDKEKLTDAHALIGEMYLLAGNCELAKSHLTWVRNKGNNLIGLSFDWAVANLDRLAKTCH